MNTGIFPPAKRGGLLFHSILLVILTAIAGWALVNLSGTSAGVLFVVYLLVAAVAFAPIPLLAYRAYALFRAQYILDRDSLELRWGLRNETIPLSDIEWVRSVNDLAQPLSGPPLASPGPWGGRIPGQRAPPTPARRNLQTGLCDLTLGSNRLH
jgi:hypothetical protein